MKVAVSGIARRAGWNLVDQVISSGTNAGLSILIARSVDQTAFGSFAVAFTVFGFLVGVSRAVSTSPLGVRFTADLAARTSCDASAVGGRHARWPSGWPPAWSASGVGWRDRRRHRAGPDRARAWSCRRCSSRTPGGSSSSPTAGRPPPRSNDAVWAVVQIGGGRAAAADRRRHGGRAGAGLGRGGRGGGAARAAPGPDPAAAAAQRPLAARAPQPHRLPARRVRHPAGRPAGGAADRSARWPRWRRSARCAARQVLLGPVTILQVAALSFAVPELSRRRRQLTERRLDAGRASRCRPWSPCSASPGVGCSCWPRTRSGARCSATPGTAPRRCCWPMILGQLGGNLAHGDGGRRSSAWTGPR